MGFLILGNKTFDFSSKKKDFLPKNDQIWSKIGIIGQFGPGHAGLFGALLVSWLVVVARGLYLARHLFTLCKKLGFGKIFKNYRKNHPLTNPCSKYAHGAT